MVDIIEIDIKEFEDKIYEEYIKLFPKEEQRDWEKIKNTYKKGIEKFYKITMCYILHTYFTKKVVLIKMK